MSLTSINHQVPMYKEQVPLTKTIIENVKLEIKFNTCTYKSYHLLEK